MRRQLAPPSTLTSIEHSVANCASPSSTVTFNPSQARLNSRRIRYASITASTCPRVCSSVRTYTGRISKCTVFDVRNAISTCVRSLYRSCTTCLEAAVSGRSVLIA